MELLCPPTWNCSRKKERGRQQKPQHKDTLSTCAFCLSDKKLSLVMPVIFFAQHSVPKLSGLFWLQFVACSLPLRWELCRVAESSMYSLRLTEYAVAYTYTLHCDYNYAEWQIWNQDVLCSFYAVAAENCMPCTAFRTIQSGRNWCIHVCVYLCKR